MGNLYLNQNFRGYLQEGRENPRGQLVLGRIPGLPRTAALQASGREQSSSFMPGLPLWGWYKPPEEQLGFMEGVWIGSMLLSLHVGPLELKRNCPGQMLVAAREAGRCGREHSSESDRSYRCYIMYISTCSRSVSLPGISSPRGRGFDYSQIFLQPLEPRLPES